MTRKVTPVGMAIAIAALLAPAPAAAARLEESDARRLALKLARQTAIKRDARSWQLSDPIKVRSNRITFEYGERSPDDVFCKARLVVEQSSTRRRAFLAGARCRPIPSEALAVERATAAMIRAVEPRIPIVARSLRRYARELRGCERLVVPRSRRDDVRRLLEIGEVVALLDPLLAQLDSFVTALQNVHPEDPELIRAVAAWRRLLILVTSLDPAAGDACTAVREWAANAYSRDSEPLDFEELRLTIEALRRQDAAIDIGANRLFDLGISIRVVSWFTLEPLVAD